MRVSRPIVTAWMSAQVAVLAVAACASPAPRPDTATTAPSTPSTAISAPLLAPPPLFYTKGGSLYISDPVGSPGRKLTDGRADSEPAPSPDLEHVAFIRKANASDYGGELWVLDLSPEREPLAAPRRLVDPATLPSTAGGSASDGTAPRIVAPRWSPTGNQVAFLEAGEGGGFLFVADAVIDEIISPEQRLFADEGYAWAPDGQHIAWAGGRSDVSPVDVNVLTVGAKSTVVAKDTNAFSVTYDKDGKTILFANADATGEMFADIPFELRSGGIYSVAAPDGTADSLAVPAALFAGQTVHGDLAVLDSGAIAFTESNAEGSLKTVKVLDPQSFRPRTVVAAVAADTLGPVWGPSDMVAYVDGSPGRKLIVTDAENRSPEQIDSGVDDFAWQPQNGRTTSEREHAPR